MNDIAFSDKLYSGRPYLIKDVTMKSILEQNRSTTCI